MADDIKLTNWQVPRDPKMAGLDGLKIAAEANPIDMKKYENVGSVEHHESVASVAEKMIQKREAATGRPVNAPEQESKINLNGIKDDRKDRVFFKLGTK